jgi:hypothetical protein
VAGLIEVEPDAVLLGLLGEPTAGLIDRFVIGELGVMVPSWAGPDRLPTGDRLMDRGDVAFLSSSFIIYPRRFMSIFYTLLVE